MARKYRLRTSLQWLDGGIQFVDATADTGNVTFTESVQGVVQLASSAASSIGIGSIGTPKMLFARASTGRVLISTRTTAATASNSVGLDDDGFTVLGLGSGFTGFRVKNANTVLSSTVEYWICG